VPPFRPAMARTGAYLRYENKNDATVVDPGTFAHARPSARALACFAEGEAICRGHWRATWRMRLDTLAARVLLAASPSCAYALRVPRVRRLTNSDLPRTGVNPLSRPLICGSPHVGSHVLR
jgi:hypothetical protein